MANWYGIEGIKFHYNGPMADWEITYKGVRDSAGIDVEETMWERYSDEGFNDPDEGLFSDYMRDNADEVRFLIEVTRGLEV